MTTYCNETGRETLKRLLTVAACLGFITTAACSRDERVGAEPEAAAPENGVAESADETEGMNAGFVWPAALNVIDDGYPSAGDDCRRLGESAAVADYLDHTAILVGCPGPRTSAAVQALLSAENAVVAGEADGVTLVSIATGSETSSSPQTNAETTEISGSITGNETGSHTFTANQGQTLNVTLSGDGTIYFNVLPPGGGPGDAIFVGSRATDADFWAGVAPASGTYTIIVYLMGNDKDAGVTRTYTIEAIAE